MEYYVASKNDICDKDLPGLGRENIITKLF